MAQLVSASREQGLLPLRVGDDRVVEKFQTILDIQSKIDHALQNVKGGSKEEGFLEKFKSALSKVSSVNELFKLCFQLAKEYKIGIAALLKLFD